MGKGRVDLAGYEYETLQLSAALMIIDIACEKIQQELACDQARARRVLFRSVAIVEDPGMRSNLRNRKPGTRNDRERERQTAQTAQTAQIIEGVRSLSSMLPPQHTSEHTTISTTKP